MYPAMNADITATTLEIIFTFLFFDTDAPVNQCRKNNTKKYVLKHF